jgi:hypothetical protein
MLFWTKENYRSHLDGESKPERHSAVEKLVKYAEKDILDLRDSVDDVGFDVKRGSDGNKLEDPPSSGWY